MITEQKQSELQRHKDILLAIIDYLLSIIGGELVLDQEDIAAEFYVQQKLQIEKYYKQRRLDKLQQRLASLTKRLQGRIDLNFNVYIKEKTGYDIDIFEDLRQRANEIIIRNEIRNQAELNEVGTMLRYYKQTCGEGEVVEQLKALLINYSKHLKTLTASERKRKGDYSQIISSVEKDGIKKETISFSTGPKTKHYVHQVNISPDGKRELHVTQWSDGKIASTYVTVNFPTASGSIYVMSGIHDGIKATWKDNATVVIETKKDLLAKTKCKQVQSFDDIINMNILNDEQSEG